MANTAPKGGKQQGQQGGAARERDGRKDQGASAAQPSQGTKPAGEPRHAEEPNLGQKRGWSVGSDEHPGHEGATPTGGRDAHGDRKR